MLLVVYVRMLSNSTFLLLDVEHLLFINNVLVDLSIAL
jgi:hypothetical protein